MKKLILAIIFAGFSGFVFSQKTYQKAEALFNGKDYFNAAIQYKDALKTAEDASLKKNIMFKIAECYRLMNFYTESYTWFEDAIANGYKDPKIYLSYGDMLARSGNLDKAVSAYSEYLKIVPGDAAGQKRLDAALFAINAMSYENSYNPVKNEISLNSVFSEYGLGWYKDGLLFSSNNMGAKDLIHGRTGEGYSDVYYSDYDEIARQFTTPVKATGGVNSKNNDGTLVYDEKNGRLYLMQTNGYLGRGNINTFTRKDDKWSKPTPTNLNSKLYSVGHPALSKEGKTLYFVSDMPGGKGGMDIWMAMISSDGAIGIPVNAGDQINTVNDEMFPFVIGDSMLFFASDGHQGMGGLDVFCSRINDGKFTSPANLGYPINSSADDFNLIIRDNLKGGLLCSNRPKGSGSDDIYSFPNFPVVLSASGIVADMINGYPLLNALVIFTYPSGRTDSIYTNNEGAYDFKGILPGQTYRIDVFADNYFSDFKTLTTEPNEYFKTYNRQSGHNIDFALIGKPSQRFHIAGLVIDRSSRYEMHGEKIILQNKTLTFEDITVSDSAGKYEFTWILPTYYTAKIMKSGYWSESRTCDATNALNQEIWSLETGHDMNFELTRIEPKKEIVLDNIYYDFGKATLRPESLSELNKVVSMMRETPNIQIEISAHTDSRGDDNSNMRLSRHRAKSCVDYLVEQGIDKRRLIAKGYGEKKPIIPNAVTEEEHQKNRRTSFTVVKIIEKKNVPVASNEKIEFAVQLIASSAPVDKDVYFEKLHRFMPAIKVESKQEVIDGKSVNIYYTGMYDELTVADKIRDQVKLLGYVESIVVPYRAKKRISVLEALEALEK